MTRLMQRHSPYYRGDAIRACAHRRATLGRTVHWLFRQMDEPWTIAAYLAVASMDQEEWNRAIDALDNEGQPITIGDFDAWCSNCIPSNRSSWGNILYGTMKSIIYRERLVLFREIYRFYELEPSP